VNIDDGYMRRIPEGEAPGPREVGVPLDREEELVNANRQVRRAWAREEAKRQRAVVQLGCGSCDHARVHHYGATDGRKAPTDERRCWVYLCRCKGWKSR